MIKKHRKDTRMQNIFISQHLHKDISNIIEQYTYDRLFVLTDTTTLKLCWPIVSQLPCIESAQMITIGDTDDNKTLDSLVHVWKQLQQGGATRHSLLINLGGGMITDLGGFAASTFKRGLTYINIPTTLLSQVDASVGGKTGINFEGLKNEIGVFSQAATVIISSEFLRSLDLKNLLSGYAEMLKHGLISDYESWAELLRFDIEDFDYGQLNTLVAKSIAIKEKIVEADPTEKNIRKALNLGHTLGHAIESLAMEQRETILHGYAVAWGIIGELYLSFMKCNFPKEHLQQTVQFIRQYYGNAPVDCKQYERLYQLMMHDKKNSGNNINFTLLGNIGDIRINQQATKNEIFEMLDFLTFNI